MSEDRKKRQKELVLAAWLHDIGKFAQRAGMEKYRTQDNEMEGQLCKLHTGGWYSHQHVLYTHGVLEAWKDIFPDEITAANVISLASRHHSPSTDDEQILAVADCTSSGSDRRQEKEQEQAAVAEHERKFYEKPMEHILSKLRLKGNTEPPVFYIPLKPLDGNSVLGTSDSHISQEAYKVLWSNFEADFKKLYGLGYEQFMQALDTVLERYWWCIPSSTYKTETDISLYQHAKTTAAFAESLFCCHYEVLDTGGKDDIKNLSVNRFLFLNGDMSGIQKYIFDLKSTKNSAKLLRARSFQIWAMGKIAVEHILSVFDASEADIITAAGGKFLVMLPDTKQNRDKVSEVKKELESYFLHEFSGRLSFILSDGTEACINDITTSTDDTDPSGVLNLLRTIWYDAERSKQKKLQHALKNDGAVLNSQYDELQKYGACSCCGINPAAEQSADGDSVCGNCKKLIEIGSRLVKADNISFDSGLLKHFGQMVSIHPKADNTYGFMINDYIPGMPVVNLPYIAPWKNRELGILKTFEDIAAEAYGNGKLAMFKADIDNLGLVFSSSLGSRTSFSRYADMSRMLHYFFSSYYVHFIEQDPVFREKIYTVYSGGDDLCVLGAWDVVLDFAESFHRKLEQVSNGNSSLTLSAGIVLAVPDTPPAFIAEKAEAALEQSKNHLEKNCITVFGTTVTWEKYSGQLRYGKLMGYLLCDDSNRNDYVNAHPILTQAEVIPDEIKGETVSSGLVYKMIDFANRAQRIKSGDIRDLMTAHNYTWMSNFRYVVARNITDEKNCSKEKLREWFYQFGINQEAMLESRIAVSYGLYSQRDNTKKEEHNDK